MTDVARKWPLSGRIGFRFIFAYLLLYANLFPLGFVPWTWTISEWHLRATVILSRWTEIHIFGIPNPTPFAFTGSSDTLERYATQLNTLLLAILATIVWSALDRHRTEYTRLYQWLRVYICFFLATVIFGYGFSKMIQSQFPSPSLERYVQPLGEYSPMGLLWTFMGSSSPYNIFTGLIEVIGGVLLLFRRTATLGALVVLGVMSNVAMLNFAYDVPVKIFSLNLLFIATVIAAPDLRRLFTVLVLDHATAPHPAEPLFASRRGAYVAAAVGTLLMGHIAWADIDDSRSTVRELADAITTSPLYGIYDVEGYTRNGVEMPPLLSDSLQWRKVVFGGDGRATFRTMSDSVSRYTAKIDTVHQSITLTNRSEPKLNLTMAFDRRDHNHVVLRMVADGDSVVARLRRVDETGYLLLRRGFNWIQEKPFNR